MYLLNHPFLFASVLFVLLYAVARIGLAVGTRRDVNRDDAAHEQNVNVRDALRLLLSLLLGFTLAMALPRFDQRRQFVVEEATSITTAFLRAGLLPAPYNQQVRGLLAKYLDLRVQSALIPLGSPERVPIAERAKALQDELWTEAEEVSAARPTPIVSLFDAALGDMITVSEKRLASLENRIPPTIWIMLTLLAVLVSFATGYSARRRVLIALLLTPLMITIVMGLTADIDSPQGGSIQIDLKSLQNLQKMVNQTPSSATQTPGQLDVPAAK